MAINAKESEVVQPTEGENGIITMGADPELFLHDTKTGEIVSAIGLVGGDKKNPRKVPYGAVQEDNVLAEFNIDPVDNLDDFKRNIREVLKSLQEIVGSRYKFQFIASHTFKEDYLYSVGPMAFKFGCDPDINAWFASEDYPTDPPTPYSMGPLRTAGGHLHIGFKRPEEVDIPQFIRILDTFLYAPIITSDSAWGPSERKRMMHYGKAGSYRKTPYGVEYRTLSNWWLREERFIDWVWNQTFLAWDTYEKQKGSDLLTKHTITRMALFDIPKFPFTKI